MSFLKPGTLCVIVAGCPQNIGVIVEVLAHFGRRGDRADAYHVRTVSARPFAQLWLGSGSGRYLSNGSHSNECITDRHKLRPLVAPKGTAHIDTAVIVNGHKGEVATIT